jgi:hypothetical protein
VAVAESCEALLTIIRDFAAGGTERLAARYGLPPDGRDWKTEWASKHARRILETPVAPARCLYRPFDCRWTVVDDYSRGFVAYPRHEVMRHLSRGNVGLILTRQLSLPTYQHVWATRHPIDGNTISLQTREYNYLFPLYVYPFAEGQPNAQADMSGLSPWPEGKDGRRPNLEPKFVEEMAGRLGLNFVSDGQGDLKDTFGPEDVFHYIYAVLHSPTYRTRYAEFLKTDFPRIPLTSNLALFRTLVEKGSELVALHLLESPALAKPITRYPVAGPNIVDPGFPRYVAPGEPSPEDGKPVEAGRVYANKGDPMAGVRGQYFEGVRREVWEFWVGGYQPCQKWLKDRRGRTLSNEDIEHYEKIVVALQRTIRLMGEIDAAAPKWPIE